MNNYLGLTLGLIAFIVLSGCIQQSETGATGTDVTGVVKFLPEVQQFLKDLIKIDRSFVQFDKVIPLFSPNQEYSFPSNHAATFSALGLSIYFYKKNIGILLLIFALLIGLARIIAGVHFPVDILGGFILGILVSFICRSFSFSASR